MAVAMRVWVDDAHIDEACQTTQVFQNDTQRIQGFASGEPASSMRVNTALRQANVVAVGLVQALAKHNSVLEGYTHETDVNTMATAIGEALAQYVSSETGSSFEDLNNKVDRIDGGKLGANTNIGEDGVPVYVKNGQITTVPVVDKAANVTTNINGHAIATIFESNGITVKNATNAANVTTNINGHAIATIFESNGTTIKNATKAVQDGSGNNIVDTYATKASLSSESSAREAADTTLQQSINSEVTARENAVSALQTSLTSGGITVAKATNATHAASADSATNATNATNAANASVANALSESGKYTLLWSGSWNGGSTLSISNLSKYAAIVAAINGDGSSMTIVMLKSSMGYTGYYATAARILSVNHPLPSFDADELRSMTMVNADGSTGSTANITFTKIWGIETLRIPA